MLVAGPARAQVPEDAVQGARLPYEQLGRRQNEVQFGVSRLTREVSSTVDVQTQITSAFIAYSRGVTARLELGVLLPYVLYSEETMLGAAGGGARAESRYGVSDPTFRIRYALKEEGDSVAVTLGALAMPDWGGRGRRFNAGAETLEPFVVLGKKIGATQLYLRYGHAYRGGEAPDSQSVTLGGRRAVGDGWGVLGTLSYSRSTGAANMESRGVPGGSLGGYADLPNGMQLVVRYGMSTSTGGSERLDDARTRNIALSLVQRF